MRWDGVLLPIFIVILGATITLDNAYAAGQSPKGALLHDTIHEEVLRLGESEHKYAREGISGKIAVYVYLDSEEYISELPHHITPIMTSGEIFSALLTMDEIYMLGELDIVSKITLPESATLHGHYTTEGVKDMGAEEMHKKGFTGKGVTIAVIDSSFILDDPEIKENVKDYKIFDAFGTCYGDPMCGNTGGSHGTAVAEIIVDMAPDAELILYTVNGGSIAYASAVMDAMLEGVDIISTSLGYDDSGPAQGNQFRAGRSHAAQITTIAEEAGIIPVISAGNEGDSHVLLQYNPSRSINLSGTNFDGYQSLLEFDSSADGIHKACLLVRADARSAFYLAWSDYWEGASHDYDLHLYDNSMSTLLEESAFTQGFTGNPQPEEWIISLDLPDEDICLVISSYNSSENHQMRILVQGVEILSEVPGVTRFGSINTPADAQGAIAVGAVDSTLGSLREYSSSGPTDDGRPKPEICGLDGVSSHQHDPDMFNGTSASAPHVTGLIAALLEARPDLKGTGKDGALEILQSHAKQDPSYSKDNLCGADSGLASLATYAQSDNANRTVTYNGSADYTVVQDGEATISFKAKDPDGDAVRIVAISGSATPFASFTHTGVGTSNITGQIILAPTTAQHAPGNYTVTLVIFSGEGESTSRYATKTYTIEVLESTRLGTTNLTLTPIPPQHVTAGESKAVPVFVSDPYVNIAISSETLAVSITGNTITLAPGPSDVGTHAVRVVAYTATQSVFTTFIITVSAADSNS